MIADRIHEVERILSRCGLCERRCGVDRMNGQTGHCRATTATSCFREYLSVAEELDLIPSHTFYLSGCNMRCTYCIAGPWVEDPDQPPAWPLLGLVERAVHRRGEGARNLHFLGGEPTVHLHNILRFVDSLPFSAPVVWNSNMYFTREAARVLDGFVHTYVADLRYGNNACACALSEVSNYNEVVRRNIRFATETARTFVRVLLLPGHIECCFRPIAEWLADAAPDAEVNLMTQYLPAHRARGTSDLGRTLSHDEIAEAEAIAQAVGLRRADAELGLAPAVGTSGSQVDATITITPQGRVFVENCSLDVLELALAVAPEDASLQARALAAGLAQGD